MKTIGSIFLAVATLASGNVWACDRLAPNCSATNVAFDNAQKGPVQPDPLSDGSGSRERMQRLLPHG